MSFRSLDTLGGQRTRRHHVIAIAERAACVFILSLLLLPLAPTASAKAIEPPSATVAPVRYKLQVMPDRLLRTFSAEMLIEFDVLEATREIVINSAGLEISSARVDDREDAVVSHDAAAQELVLGVTQPACGPRVSGHTDLP